MAHIIKVNTNKLIFLIIFALYSVRRVYSAVYGVHHILRTLHDVVETVQCRSDDTYTVVSSVKSAVYTH